MYRYSYCMTNLQKGLVGHWSMDNSDTSSGTLYDISAYDNHGRINGAPTIGSTGKIGNSYSFSGTEGDAIEYDLSSIEWGSQHTISGWVYINSTASHGPGNFGGPILADGNFDTALYTEGTSPDVRFYVKPDDSSSGPTIIRQDIEADTWNHVVGVRDATNTAYIYLNGVEVSKSEITGVDPITSNTFYSGDNLGTGGDALNGKLDSIRVYNRALSDSEINALYQQRNTRQTSSRGFPVAAGNLVARYPFRGGSARDDARNANYADPTAYDGTVNGATYESKGGQKADGAFSFDGNDDYIDISSIGSKFDASYMDNGFSISAWWKPNGNNGDVLGQSGLDNDNLRFIKDGTRFYIDHSGNTDLSPLPVNIGSWNHGVITSDGTTATAYMNGIQQQSVNVGNFRTSGTNSPWTIGSRGGVGGFFDGKVEDVRFYDKPLSQSEVSKIYQNTRPQISASGGTTVTTERINGEQYRIHAFENIGSSTFEVSDAQANATADVLVVGGGGGAGIGINSSDEGTGGGGAGEVINDSVNISPQSYTITVADGGNSGTTDNIDGNDGGNSQAFGFTATGGFGSARTEGYSTAGGDYGGDGNPGGESNLGDTTSDAADDAGGGGGGASEPGQQAPSEYEAGDGGDGLDVSNIFGTQFGENGVFGGGGGGGVGASEDGTDVELGVGGNGGGGNGGESSNISAEDGIDNTGGGAGGASQTGERAGNGGSGIVLIRYKL